MPNVVLAREVKAGGVLYPTGTALEALPAEYRESLERTGWTRLAPPKPAPKVVAPVPELTVPEPTQAEDAATLTDSDEPIDDEADQITTDPTDDSVPTDAELDDSPSLYTLDISEELKELLTTATIDGQPLQTIADVIAFGEANKGFRVIKGIGKVGNEEIQAAIAAL